MCSFRAKRRRVTTGGFFRQGSGAGHISGRIERVTFHSEETGFSVLQVLLSKGGKVTVVGKAADPKEGEEVQASGEWKTDGKYGRQFAAEEIRTSSPATVDGIRKYLASGLINGIGDHYADKLVERFGENVLDVIENESHKLLTVSGIGKKRLEKIREGWKRQRSVKEIMLFLYSHGVGTGRAFRILKELGEDAVEKLKKDPFRLCREVWGIGFKTADEIAERMGVSRDSPLRIRAALEHVIDAARSDGNCALSREIAFEKCEKLLGVDRHLVEQAANILIERKKVKQFDLDGEVCLAPLELVQGGAGDM
ncbi:MAG: helix-hairpin-helix domain-containing protein [Planctomycetota bacterium]|nr:helix-hairpin-helix domain-containing protein [Planctomycetota bacterium]